MGKVLQLVNGLPTMVNIPLTNYDESIEVTTDIGTPGTGYDSDHKVFTLPNSETYDGTTDELKVERNGVGQVEGVHFDYTASSTATTITFINAIPKNARVRFFKVT